MMPEEGNFDCPARPALVTAFRSLSAEDRAILWLHCVEGDDFTTVAECLGLPRSLVERRFASILQNFETALPGPDPSLLGKRLQEIPTPEPPCSFVQKLADLWDRVR